MKILVTGSSGLIGSALSKALAADGHDVVPLPRKRFSEGAPFWDPENGVIDLAGIADIDAVVHLAGDSIAQGRWNDQKKARILDSRVKGTRLLAEYFAAASRRPQTFVSASAIGVYGDCQDTPVDEDSPPGSGFLAEVGKQSEAATAAAANAGIRVVNARFGIVLSPTGGALEKMLPPFRMGLGGVLGSGKQYLSWVSIQDVTQMLRHVLANEALRGPVNLVSPNPVSNREFTQELGRALHRPTLFAMPAFAARLAFGEMADEALLSSTRVLPKKLMASGYAFVHPELKGALAELLR